MEKEEGILVLKRVHVHYRLEAGSEHEDTVERVHRLHRDRCPVYRSIHTSIDVTTSYELLAAP